MDEKYIEVLIFQINNEYYATDILDVERILGKESITLIPDVPDFVEGVINYENDIIPVLNLSKKFNIKSNMDSEQRKIIILKKEENKFGVMVDNVHEVAEIDKKCCEPMPDIVGDVSKRKGLIKTEGKIIILLDMLGILSKEEEERIF